MQSKLDFRHFRSGGKVLNRVALITGGSRGLGLATAKELQARGFKLLIVGLDKQLTQNALRILTDLPKYHYISGDITKAGTCTEVARVCREMFDRLDVLVNNAGMYIGGAIEEFPESSWDQILGVNLKSHFLMTKAVAPLLKESQGQIVFINSIGGKQGQANNSAYCASKFGLQGLADSLRLELKPFKIRVTSVFPNNMNSAGEVISAGDARRLQLLETADVARLIGDVADAPAYAQIPEIQILPLSTEVSKHERTKYE